MSANETAGDLIVGETVVYEDAYTKETRYGRVVSVLGSNVTVRTITKEEAGPTPMRLRAYPRV